MLSENTREAVRRYNDSELKFDYYMATLIAAISGYLIVHAEVPTGIGFNAKTGLLVAILLLSASFAIALKRIEQHKVVLHIQALKLIMSDSATTMEDLLAKHPEVKHLMTGHRFNAEQAQAILANYRENQSSYDEMERRAGQRCSELYALRNRIFFGGVVLAAVSMLLGAPLPGK